ncbi:MAG TPA: AraC family transcriptional regulator [Blastocatellia bacterium]|nr:AraC family transcriptional regulator [Blastocatellia bacterium]
MSNVSIEKELIEPGLPDGQPIGRTERIISRPQFLLRYTAGSGCEFAPHSHAAFTVTSVLEGCMQVTIGPRVFDVSAGETALTGIGETHAARSAGVEFLSIRISPAAVGELAAEIGMTRATAEITFRECAVRDEALIGVARSIAGEIASGRAGHLEMIDALVRQTIIHLLRSHLTVRKSARIELSRAGPVDRRLRRALEFMHDNFAEDLGLEEIAASAYLSEYHFARLFKQVTGMTPHVYLANLRLERARKLLVESEMSVGEVAASVGYQSQSHFTKVFKSMVGLTPRAYREGATRQRGGATQ